jgi:hypothetical protein
MKKINFAYDGKVSSTGEGGWRHHYNSYDHHFYPTNGPWEDCYYDYHAPLQTVFENNGIPTASLTMQEALSTDEFFIYNLTFRYFPITVLGHYLKHNISNVPDNYNFFQHIPIGVVEAVNSGRCLLVLNDGHECSYYDDVFYKLLVDKLTAAKFTNFNNIILITGNAANRVIDNPVNTVFWQYFETATRLTFLNVDIDFKNKFHNTELLKKFLCFNRIAREVRYYFMYQMYKNEIINEFRASLNKVDNVEQITSYNDNMFLDEIKNDEKFSEMLNSLPWVIDSDEFHINHWNRIDLESSANSLIFIVTETLFMSGDNLFLTEKTFKPIGLKMPFIILGNPYTLKHMRNLGYKTFSSLWDESYDDEPDTKLRMDKICLLVKSLANLDTDDLKNKIISARDIIEHNHNLLMSRRPELNIINKIKEQL